MMLPIVARVRLRYRGTGPAGGSGVPAQESFTWDRTVSLPGCVTKDRFLELRH